MTVQSERAPMTSVSIFRRTYKEKRTWRCVMFEYYDRRGRATAVLVLNEHICDVY